MKAQLIKKSLLVASLVCASLNAQAYTSGDILLLFRNANDTSKNDLIVDLGQIGNLNNGTLALPTTAQVGAVGNQSDINWTLMGGDKTTLYQADPTSSGILQAQSKTSQAGAGNAAAALGALTANGNNPATVAQSDAASYTSAAPDSGFNTFSVAIEGNGAQTLDIYKLDSSNAGHDGMLLGHVTLNADNTVTLSGFTAVPEAANIGMVAAGAMMVMFAFNTLRARQATR